MKIQVNKHPFSDGIVFVDGLGWCQCDIDTVSPQSPINYSKGIWLTVKVCENCGLKVSREKVDRFNQLWGYSGYDE